MSEAPLLTTATRGLVAESGEGGLELVLTTESGVLGRLAVSSVDEAWGMVAQE